MGTILDRIQEISSKEGISIGALEKQIGASKGVLSRAMNKGTDIQSKWIQTLVENYPAYSSRWLLTGEGEMLNKEGSNTPAISYTKGVPYYNVDFLGGFDLVLNDQTATPEYLIDFKKYNDATCWCNVTGHSMEPEINHGDIIALRQIDDFSFFPMGEVYAIVTTNDMRTIKRIGPSLNPNCYSLVPTNKAPEYGVQDLPKDKIKALFQVLGCMKRL